MLFLLVVLIFGDLTIHQLYNPAVPLGNTAYNNKLATILREFHKEFPHTTEFNGRFADVIKAMAPDDVLALNLKDHLNHFKEANFDAILKGKIDLAIRERTLYTYDAATMKFKAVTIVFDKSDKLLHDRQQEMYRVMLTSYQNTLQELAEHPINDGGAHLQAYTKEFTSQTTKILVTNKAELRRLIAAGKSPKQILSQNMRIDDALFEHNAQLVGISDDMARVGERVEGRSSWLGRGERSLSRSESSLGRLSGAAQQIDEHRKGNGMGAVLAIGAVAAVGTVALVGGSLLSRPDYVRGPMMPPVGQMGMGMPMFK